MDRKSSRTARPATHGFDLGLEQRVEQQVGVKSFGRVEQVAAVEHHQAGYKFRGIGSERGPDVSTHRGAEHAAAAQPQGAHRIRDVERVLADAVSGEWLVWQ